MSLCNVVTGIYFGGVLGWRQQAQMVNARVGFLGGDSESGGSAESSSSEVWGKAWVEIDLGMF